MDMEIPLSSHNYIMSADVARGDSKDYSTFHIIDTGEGEIVAEYKGKIPLIDLGIFSMSLVLCTTRHY